MWESRLHAAIAIAAARVNAIAASPPPARRRGRLTAVPRPRVMVYVG
jgi:hypothetical protein